MFIRQFAKTFFIFIASFFFLFYYSAARSQERLIDSLLASLKTHRADTGIIMTYIRLSRSLENNDPEMGLGYAGKALKLSKQTGFDKGTGIAMKLFGNYHFDKNEYDKALEYYKASYQLLIKAGDTLTASGVLSNMGGVYGLKGDYTKSLEYFIKALMLDESIGNKKGMATTTSNMGEMAVMQGDLSLGLKYHLQSLALKKETGFTSALSRSYNNIGMVYSLTKKYDSALFYLQEAVVLAERFNSVPDMVNAYGNISSTYLSTGNIDSGLFYIQKSTTICEQMDNRYGVALNIIESAKIYEMKKDYNNAFAVVEKGYQIGKDIKSDFILNQAYLEFAHIYAAIGRYDSAYAFYQRFSILKDTLLNEDRNRQIAEMATRYETEKKQKEIELQSEKINRQQADISRQRIISIGIALCLLLALLLAFFIFRGYRQKKAANALLEKKNEEITRQKIIIEEKNTNITDSINYASRIQQAILTPVNVIRQSFPNCFIIYRPKDIISGDFYFFEKVNDWILFAAVDCTGHGVPGALISMVGNSLLNEIATDSAIKDLSFLFNELDLKLKKALNPAGFETAVQDGMDISMLAYNCNTKQIQVAGANNPVLFFRGGVCTEVEPARFGIGDYLKGNKNFTHKSFIAEAGDVFFLYTDGFEDQLGGPNEKKFKSKRFKALLSEISEKEISEQQQILEKTFEEWKGSGEQTDDVTVIGIRI